jgi:hypothetical protein
VVARPCEVSWELDIPSRYCVAPLRLGGLRRKQSTLSVGWEVPVRSRRSASESGTEHVDDTQSRQTGNGTLFG